MKVWGYWATFGWAVLAFFVGQFGGLALIVLLRRGGVEAVLAAPFDGVLVSQILLVSNPITIALIALAVRLARASFRGYLALEWPRRLDLTAGLAALAVLIAASDAILYLTGQLLVTPFQSESYSTAAAAGWLAPMLFATVILAPAGEEVLFRGFLFRGWARSPRSVWPAIVAISLLWAALHIQYDWVGMLQIFVVGLFLGWMRWLSGSTLLTFMLHALFNLEGTIETVVQLYVLAH